MNTFWLKIAAFIVVILVIVVVVNNVLPPKEETPEPTKTFYDVAEKDKERLSAEPRPEDFAAKPQEQTETDKKEPAEPMKLYFKEISEIEQIEAERLLNAAVPARSMGRLQIGFNLMVKNCRQITEHWPDTLYDYKARRMLKDMPERFRKRYKITAEDIDLTRFTQPKPGTKVFIMEEEQ